MKSLLNFIGILVIFCSFIACENKTAPNQLPLFNKYIFKIDSNETQVDLDSLAQAPYQKLCNNMERVQLPLYRILQGENYRLYLGVPFHTNVEKLYKLRLQKLKGDTTYQQNGNKHNAYRQIKVDSVYITEYITQIGEESLIYVCGMSTDSSLYNTVFAEEKIKNRIIQPKKK